MWFRRKRILAVCSGNTCRSPMVEGYLKSILSRWKFKVESAGTSTSNGQPPTSQSAIAMKGIGIDINSHRSRQLTKAMVDKADLIIALSESHAKCNLLRVRDNKFKVLILGVSDPYGGDQQRYYECRNEIIEKLDEWMEKTALREAIISRIQR